MRAERFVRQVVSCTTYHPDGTVETTRSPAVWTLAHKGYSGSGRLDVWCYPSKAAALYEGAQLALACGLDEDDHAVRLFETGKYAKLLDYYEQTRPETHILRVQPAFLQDEY
jgi:hypothetical protein